MVRKEGTMRIALITDLHTGLEGEHPFHVNLRKNFVTILKALAPLAPDMLVLGGDLCLRDGDTQIYFWQKARIDEMQIPYFIIPGNHDDTTLLSNVFDTLPTLREGEIYHQEVIRGHEMIFLDTHKGYLSSRQKRWLKQNLAQCQSSRLTIFMHHPPELMNVPHMDRNHALQDRVEVMSLLLGSKTPLDVFCGHYHVEKTISIKHINIHVTPSCYFQIDDQLQTFSIAHKNIGYRIIDLDRDRIEHMVYYLPGNVDVPAEPNPIV